MSYTAKEWKDRVSEYANRRTINKEDGTSETVTVERAEGKVSTIGDAFSAETMNDLENRIAAAIEGADNDISTLDSENTKIKTSLNNLFQYDSSTGRLVINLDAL